MSHQNPVTTDGIAVERVAARTGRFELLELARAAFDAGESVVRQFGWDATALAAFCVVSHRCSVAEVDRETACERLDLEPATVARAEEALEGELSPPASDEEIRSLRRALIAVRELLAGIDAGRTNAPRLPRAVLEDVDPSLAALADRPLDELDEAELRAHCRRLEADLELARLGVDLYAAINGDVE